MSKREIKALRARWSRALDVAAHAVATGRKAETLPASFCDEEVRHITAERQWLEIVRWP
jgi:hypothetical protein